MNNDSTFTAPYGAMVLNDTLDVFVRGSGADILLPLNKVKRVSYKKRWLGILPGLLIGTGAAFMSAGADYSLNAPWLFFVTFPGCIIGGAVWGYLGGYNYVYLFNQSNISNNKSKK